MSHTYALPSSPLALPYSFRVAVFGRGGNSVSGKRVTSPVLFINNVPRVFTWDSVVGMDLYML